MRHNAAIVFEALLEGIEVQIGTYHYMIVDASEDSGREHQLTIRCYTADGKVDKSRRLNVSFDMQGFISECQEMSDDEIALVAMDMTLRKQNRRE